MFKEVTGREAMRCAHRSPFKGLSTEFADHRKYVKGDDLKRLDWKVCLAHFT